MATVLEKLLERFNPTLSAEAILTDLELEPQADSADSRVLIARCPLHNEQGNTSLRVYTGRNCYVCENEKCPGHEEGNLIKLYAKARKLSYEDAGLKLFNTFGLQTTEENASLKWNLYIAFAEKLSNEELGQAAKNMLIVAFKEFPRNMVVISRLINIYSREGNKEKTCNFLLRAARLAAENKNYDSARTAIKRVFSLDAENKKARELLGKIISREWADFYSSADNSHADEESLMESLKETTITPTLRFRLTEILLKNKRPEMLKRLYSDLPEDLDYEQQEHLEEVARRLSRCIGAIDDVVAANLLLSDILMKLNNPEPAREAILNAQKAIENGKSPEYREEVAARLKDFENLIVKKQYEHALALMQTGNYEAALVGFERALETGEITAEIAEKKIHCHFKLGQYEEAQKACLAIAGLYQLEKKRADAALSLYRALIFQPRNKEALFKLIEVFKQYGANDQAEQVAELAGRLLTVEPIPGMDTEKKSAADERKPSPPVIAPPMFAPPRIRAEAPPPPAEPAEDFYPIEIPIRVRFYTSSDSTDRIAPIEATTVSIAMTRMVINCGIINIPGIKPASMNYVLQNCQIMGTLILPEHDEPIRIFGKITKIQNRREGEAFQKVITAEFQETSDPGIKVYESFVKKMADGDYKPAPVAVAPAKSHRAKDEKITKELLVSVRFLDENGEEKTGEIFYANTVSIQRNGMNLNMGDLNVNGVPQHSLSYFLKNSTFELTIPLPETNQTARLFAKVHNVQNMKLRGKRSKIIELALLDSSGRDKQVYIDYLKQLT